MEFYNAVVLGLMSRGKICRSGIGVNDWDISGDSDDMF
jgi:hypothetical protein